MKPDVTLGGLLDLVGAQFLQTRFLVIPIVLVVLLIGVLEKHGLQERAGDLIRRLTGATAGRVLLAYAAVRQISIALGIVIGSQASMVRPLVAPMAEAAGKAKHPGLSAKLLERIRAHAAAVDNVASFFGEDIFVAVAGVLLIKGFMAGLGIQVGLWKTALWGLPTAVAGFLAIVWRTRALDRGLRRDSRRKDP
jgi:uncharacterized membrane protein